MFAGRVLMTRDPGRRARPVSRDFLRQQRDADARFQPELPGIGRQLAGEQAQQGGFPGAVAAEQRQPFARFHGERSTVQQHGAAEAQVDIVQR